VLLPSDTYRKHITSITAVLLQFVTCLLTLPRTVKEQIFSYHFLNEWYLLCSANCLPATKRIQIIKQYSEVTCTNVQKYIRYILANPVSVNPDQNMKNETFCSQFSTYFKRGPSDCVERLKPRKKISKIGLSWMKETLDFSF
jgi:hypothetical protein